MLFRSPWGDPDAEPPFPSALQDPWPESQAVLPLDQPPGLVSRTPGPERRPGAGTPESFMGVAATTPIELPDEIIAQLNRPISELLEEEPLENAPSPVMAPPGPSKPLELPPDLIDSVQPKSDPDANKPKGFKGRGLLIAASVVVLGLTAFFTSPAWRKSDAVPQAAQVARDEAVALLRRDDAGSQEEALVRLRRLAAEHPQSIELLAEVGVALALHLDDTQVRVTTLGARVKGLQAQISQLTVAQTPADWQSRANAMQDELTAAQRELQPLEERSRSLSLEAVQVLKRMEASPEKEPREHTLARLRARALIDATLGGNEAPRLAVQLAQAELRDWSALAMAEYVLNQATPSPVQMRESALALEQLRDANKTYLRAYVLGARITLLRRELVAAQALLDTVITLNPKHELAQQLHTYAQELAEQERAPQPLPERRPEPVPAPTPAPTPAPQGTPTGGSATPAPGTSAPGGPAGSVVENPDEPLPALGNVPPP